MTACVVARLPNAGLANKLFVWAKAQVFAKLNGLRAQTLGWSYPKIGPLLRGERSARMYARFFDTSSGPALLAIGYGRLRGAVVVEPSCTRLAEIDPASVYLFQKVPHWSDYFADIREHREFVRARLLSMVKKRYLAEFDQAKRPVIAIHVRRGDFRPLKPGEDFRRVGLVRTPDAYFEEIVQELRAAAGYEAPITVFSDGTDAELSFLLTLPAVARAKTSSDFAELLLMSRAQVIVTSAGSTFGEWASYSVRRDSRPTSPPHPRAHPSAPRAGAATLRRPASADERGLEGPLATQRRTRTAVLAHRHKAP